MVPLQVEIVHRIEVVELISLVSGSQDGILLLLGEEIHVSVG